MSKNVYTFFFKNNNFVSLVLVNKLRDVISVTEVARRS